MPQVVGQGRSDELGSLIQSLIAFLGMTSLAPSLMLLHLRPQSFIGRADLAGNGTSHLCRYVVPCPYLLIRALLQGNLVAHLAMCKRIARDIVQSVTISQLCGSQYLKLFSIGMQFEFGGQHYFHQFCMIVDLMKMSRPGALLHPVQGNPHSSPVMNVE